jgi:hypothetical protein
MLSSIKTNSSICLHRPQICSSENASEHSLDDIKCIAFSSVNFWIVFLADKITNEGTRRITIRSRDYPRKVVERGRKELFGECAIIVFTGTIIVPLGQCHTQIRKIVGVKAVVDLSENLAEWGPKENAIEINVLTLSKLMNQILNEGDEICVLLVIYICCEGGAINHNVARPLLKKDGDALKHMINPANSRKGRIKRITKKLHINETFGDAWTWNIIDDGRFASTMDSFEEDYYTSVIRHNYAKTLGRQRMPAQSQRRQQVPASGTAIIWKFCQKHVPNYRKSWLSHQTQPLENMNMCVGCEA